MSTLPSVSKLDPSKVQLDPVLLDTESIDAVKAGTGKIYKTPSGHRILINGGKGKAKTP